ncbi:MAG: DUF3105 domain-containing protein [Chloroflexota bacterium]|nr:DUF3105 domain-containing protein [Chloroflexota bacterium]
MRRILAILVVLSGALTAPDSIVARLTPVAPSPVVDSPSYRGPTYGHLLSWGPDWTVLERDAHEGVDYLLLTSDTTRIEIQAYPAVAHTPDQCLQRSRLELETHGAVWLEREVAGQHLPGGDRASAAALYRSEPNGSEAASLHLVQCRPFPATDAMLLLHAWSPETTFDHQALAVLYLFDAVVLPGLSGTPVPALMPLHVKRGEPHSPYNSTPPTSGPHYGDEIAAWGVHDQPIEDEVQVHNLEHGGVLLQYGCTCPEVRALLERFAAPETGYPTKVIAAPNPNLETDVALTAWHYIWTMPASEVTEEGVRSFIEAHIDQGFEHVAAETAKLDLWRESTAPTP